MDEFRLIEEISKLAGVPARGVRTGIGDDAALVRAPVGQDLVLTTDVQIEGIHFQWTWISASGLGYRAAMACLSDLAAMGARPWVVLSSLAIPRNLSRNRVLSVQKGLDRALRQTGTALVGGNVSASPDAFSVTLAAIGTVPRGQAVSRYDLQIGDPIWVTGYPGSAALGILQLRAGRVRTRFVQAYRRPEARLELGQILRRTRLARAMIDLSDGLAGDVGHMLAGRSGVRLEEASLPMTATFRRECRHLEVDPLELFLHGGDDYELLFATPADVNEHRVRILEKRSGIPIRRIGVVEARPGIRIRDRAGGIRGVETRGFRHQIGTS